MCAIVDKNVVGEVFGPKKSEAGKKFLDWVNAGSGAIVVGGYLSRELGESRAFRNWANAAVLSGNLKRVNDAIVEERTGHVKRELSYKSNDPHIIGLAQASGARLLFSNDHDLQQDFTNKKLVDEPRGKVYSTKERKEFSASHKRLLRRKDLCQKLP